MNQFSSIEQSILNIVTPTQKDRTQLYHTINTIIDYIQKELNKKTIDAKITLVGSTAKDTYLRNSLDIDIFLIYPVSIAKETIASHTKIIGKTILHNTEECYAEHPYIRGTFNQFQVELVPCYHINDAREKITAVDRTPLHTSYILRSLKSDQIKEVRLFKQFLKGISCYGAEAAIQGFSGYLCELLIIHYQTFHQLITRAQHWKKGKTISLTNHPICSFDDSLIFIDPVDAERNVASALSDETFHRFITACTSYLHNPLITFFFPKQVDPWDLSQIRSNLQHQPYKYVGVRFSKPSILAENLYPQLRKALRSITTACENNDFNIHDTRFYIDSQTDQIYLIIKTSKDPLSSSYIHKGPPITLPKNTKEFIEKWIDHPALIKPPFQQNGRMNVVIKRPYQHIDTFLKDNLATLSLGKHIDQCILHGFTILHKNELIKDELSSFWTQYLDDKNPWER